MNWANTRISLFLLLFVPMLIFIGRWFRWYYALPVIALLLYASWQVVTAIRRDSKDRPFHIGRGAKAILLILPFYLIMSQIGGFAGQTGGDVFFRNSVLLELTIRPWPVTGEAYGNPGYMCYYFVYWIIPALVGKLFGGSYDAAQVALYLYSYVCMALLMLMVLNYCRRRPFLVGLLFLVFATPDKSICQILSFAGIWIEYPFVGNNMLLCITRNYHVYMAGMSLLMILYTLRSRTGVILFFYAMLLLYAPFFAVSVTPVIAVAAAMKYRHVLTWANMAGIILIILTVVFFMGNVRAQSMAYDPDDELSWPTGLWVTLFFIVFRVIVYFPILWSRISRDWIFWTLFVTTVMLCCVWPGYGSADTVWKIPSVLTLYLMLKFIRMCAYMDWNFHRWRTWYISVLVALGIFSVGYTSHFLVKHWYSHSIYPKRNWRAVTAPGYLFSPDTNICYGNFIVDYPTFYSEHMMP